MRPAALWLIGCGLLGAGGYAIYAVDPAGRVRSVVENAAELGLSAGLEVVEVVVEGRENTPPDLIRAAIGAELGDPMLGFSPNEARERLETIAWVESAHVERRLPGTILVRLTERAPFAIWQHQGRFAVIDREGLVVETETLDAFGPLPLVVGAGAEKHAAALYDLLLAHRNILARTQALVRVGERRWNLRLHSGTDVLLPEGHEAPALNRLSELQSRNALLDRPLVAVDMRLPDRLVVRQQPVAEQPATPARRNANRSTRG
ncbi:FtsQ-type POTRA domain-containing protein [Roseomonas frigidaquae]|uniref:Cell division protein FtsQ n=2 Tax=Falsiroseomonas frigidaquae TaxID=487318 RepID=A0ABX1F840_9PROT|nr:FtsQ-type POTRA domain-containing protein [Falsiroseomonas frigidaquae]